MRRVCGADADDGGQPPRYGSADAPTVNEVAQRYVEQGTEETGAVNTVAGMILDYRAFDTLGESFVLFTAVCAVTILMNLSPKSAAPAQGGGELRRRSHCGRGVPGLIPVILLFGVYILLNGHLSPAVAFPAERCWRRGDLCAGMGR